MTGWRQREREEFKSILEAKISSIWGTGVRTVKRMEAFRMTAVILICIALFTGLKLD